jgi:hypothetical protein
MADVKEGLLYCWQACRMESMYVTHPAEHPCGELACNLAGKQAGQQANKKASRRRSRPVFQSSV